MSSRAHTRRRVDALTVARDRLQPGRACGRRRRQDIGVAFEVSRHGAAVQPPEPSCRSIRPFRLHPAQPLGCGRRSRRRRLGELHHAHPGVARNSSTMTRAASAAALLHTLCGAFGREVCPPGRRAWTKNGVFINKAAPYVVHHARKYDGLRGASGAQEESGWSGDDRPVPPD
jgi:hypothetical protein